MGRLQTKLDVLLQDGTRLSAVVDVEETIVGNRTTSRITLRYNENVISEESKAGPFFALQGVRIVLERSGALLHCFGASEDVYPSGMQLSMNGGVLAYRTQLGRRGSLKDVVNIFASDASVKPSTVEQQRLFHEKWCQSLL